jgi:hypothetical protein
MREALRKVRGHTGRRRAPAPPSCSRGAARQRLARRRGRTRRRRPPHLAPGCEPALGGRPPSSA